MRVKCIHRFRLAWRCQSPGCFSVTPGPSGPGAAGAEVDPDATSSADPVSFTFAGLAMSSSPWEVSWACRVRIDTQDNGTAPPALAQVRLRSRASRALVPNVQSAPRVLGIAPLAPRLVGGIGSPDAGCSVRDNHREDPMATESGVVHGAPASSQVSDKGLKKGAIGYVSNIVIGVASTAPAYSMAATLGFIVAVKGVGVHAPAVMLVAFLPMLLVAAAYQYFNRADPDAGTTFAWTTRAFGPATGWLNGWAIFLADVIVMASLSDIAAVYTFKLFGFKIGRASWRGI